MTTDLGLRLAAILSTTVWLLAAFLLVCVAKCVAGFLLCNGHRGGAVLALGHPANRRELTV